MKPTIYAAFAFALLFAVLPISAESTSDKSTILNGEFHWTGRDYSGPVEARFSQTGEDQWDVSFHFEFRDRPHTYSGTAEGSLTSGTLNGEVMNEEKKRTFTFLGSFEDGMFEGTHAEIRDDELRDTGTITLKAKE